MSNNLDFTEEISNKIIGLLDGWVIEEPVTPNNSSDNNELDPFLTTPTKANKVVSSGEVEVLYDFSVTQALMYCNRLNIDDLDTVTADFFINGVCYWTASNMWQKYNIRVSNDDLEDQYIQSYGGLLYKKGKNILDRFVVTRMSNYHGKKNNSVWLV